MVLHPKIIIVILNWNGRDDTLECLDSVYAIDYPNLEVMVVDNGSVDGSVAAIKERFPGSTVLETGKNLGYAGGNNVGIRGALRNGGDFIFLLNNDAIVKADILNSFLAAAGKFPDAGVFGAKIYYQAEPRRLWYAGAQWCEKSGTFEHLGLNDLDVEGRYDYAQDTDHACGCAMFLRASAVHDVGLLEPRFFLTFEEADWCFRAKKKGYRSIFVPSAKAWHKVSASFGGENSSLFLYFYTRNRLLWAERHLSVSNQLRVWRRTVADLMPARDFRSDDGFKRTYWKARAWTKTLAREWSSPSRQAMRRAVADYVFRSFGDCPQSIRDATDRPSFTKFSS